MSTMKPTTTSAPSSEDSREHGYSLVEVLVVMLILGVLLAIAIPSLKEVITSTRLTSQANDLMSDALLARSEAASRGVRIAMCPSTDQATCAGSAANWTQGRIIYVDADASDSRSSNEQLIKVVTSLSGDSSLTPGGFINVLSVAFNPYGGLLPLGSSGTFKLCSASSPNGRQIAVGISGRAMVSRTACL
jgi:type IV fimbrial biogenesis protein FimT